MQTPQDTELIAQTLDGDDDSFAEIVDRYKNAVYYHCFAILKDEASAQDVAQETFIAAYYSLSKYNPKYKLATWLFRIATNKSFDYIRKSKHVLKDSEVFVQRAESRQKQPEQEQIEQELHAAVAALKPKYRAVVSLYYWQGQTYAEIAHSMNAPINSVRVWLRRAKAQLKEDLS